MWQDYPNRFDKATQMDVKKLYKLIWHNYKNVFYKIIQMDVTKL